MVEAVAEGASLGELHLKGFNHPVLAVEILRWREDGEQAASVAKAEPADAGRGAAKEAVVRHLPAQLVVPAKAGTHTPRRFVLSMWQRAFLRHRRQGLRVPAGALPSHRRRGDRWP